MTNVKVVHIEQEWDMRAIHSLCRKVDRKLRDPSHAALAFNKKQTMARLIMWADAGWAVTTMYASKDYVFDVAEINGLLASTHGVKLQLGSARMSKLKVAA